MRNARELDIAITSSQSSLKLPNINSSRTKLNTSRKRNYSLFNYEKLSELPKIYPDSNFKLTTLQIDDWLQTKCDSNDEPEDVNYIDTDEDKEVEQGKTTSVNIGPLVIGPKAMADFFEKYKTLNKITSPANESNPLPVFQYLKHIDKVRSIPQPMGMVKRNGLTTELHLQ